MKQEKQENIEQIYKRLSKENQNILNLVAKSMLVATNGVEVSIKRKLA